MQAKKSKDATKKRKKVQGFRVLENECIWMKAGVINFRECDNVYDCNSCAFDKGMMKTMSLKQKAGVERKIPGWAEHLKKQYDGSSRPCRHSLTGRIDSPKICTMDYECFHCPFDQMIEEPNYDILVDAPNYKAVSGYRMANGYYYHMGHSWARFEHGGRVRVGFDDFLTKTFGTPSKIDLPPLGTPLEQNQVGWAFTRDEKKAAVLSPISGTILAINRKAQAHPEIIQSDPYNEGWLFMIEPDTPRRNLKGLYFGEESSKWMDQEGQKMMELMGPEYERLAANGGEVIQDVYGSLPDIGWDKLVDTFLRTTKT